MPKKLRKKREERISFNVFDELTQSYTGKFFAYTEPSLATALHRGNGYRVRFNSVPQFPQILEKLEDSEFAKPQKNLVDAAKYIDESYYARAAR